MGQNLVIVESPAKAKTISKYLGKNYIVEASMGHVRDLPKSKLGVDIEDNFTPKYITIRGKGELIDKLRKAAKKADKIYLATDPDREGEAISWHLAYILKISEEENCRIVFNEITKSAVKASIKEARKINVNLVDAQQARRILDRLVGYEISPILWKNVKWGLSAGRVQSAALKLICDREEEIKAFIPKEYWTVDCSLKKERKKFPIRLTQHEGKKIEIKNEEEAKKIINDLEQGNFVVKTVKKGKRMKNPLPPFTTSTLQQDASKKLNFITKRTMSIAQALYEGVEVKGYGTVGLITYMRTDSVRISEEAQGKAVNFIKDNYGDEYVPEQLRVYKSKKNIQDAHEAIRPSYIEGKQHFTQPPARYTEASFVKLLEEKGIGRPSTYVPTISTLLSREYIVREKKNLMATELGFIVNNILSEYFKQIVDVDFTAAMEGKLDNIEEGSEYWTNVVEEFFAPLKVAIDKAEKEVSKVVIEDKVSDIPCDKCGKMMVIKHGRYGDFLACPGYPECKNAKPIVEELDVDCPKCGGKVLVKRSKKGKKFFGCSNYPECDFVSWNEPVKDKCEECGSYMVLKYSKTKGKYAQCSNSDCGNIKIVEEKEN